MIRKAIARAILTTVVGLLYEVQCERPRLARAPFTGAAVLGAAAAVKWACEQLADDVEQTAQDVEQTAAGA